VDNGTLEGYVREAESRMAACSSPCKREIAPAGTREWIRRKLLLRDFFNRRVAVFVDVKRDDVRKELARRSSSPDNAAVPTREEVREEMLEARIEEEIRKLANTRRIEIQGDPFANGGSMSSGLYALTVRTSSQPHIVCASTTGTDERVCSGATTGRWKLRWSRRRLDDRGIALDFRILKTSLNDLLSRFDHRYLNEVAPFDGVNPSSENLARHLYEEMGKSGPGTGACVPCHRVGIDDARADYSLRD